MATKSIGISEVTAQDLAREASKHKVSRDKVISKMLDFFRIYGIDPFNYDAPADEMQKIIKRMDSVVAFIKKQEKDILIPTLTRLATKEDAANSVEQTRGNLNKLLELLREDSAKLQEENKELKKQLDEARKQAQGEHQKVTDMVVSQISQMLQITMDTGVMGGKKQAIENLKQYER